MTSFNNSDFPLESLYSLLRSAGEHILKIYTSSYQVNYKSDQSPVTAADEKSHEILCEGLEKLFPSLPIFSEEGFLPPLEKRRTINQFWLLDPLDGTKEFIRGNGEFCISLGLVQGQAPQLGLLYFPVQKIFCWAQKGKGSGYALADQIGKTFPPADFQHAQIFISHSSEDQILRPYMQAIKNILPNIKPVRRGSAQKFFYLANAEGSVYLRPKPAMEWDLVAGHCLAEERGFTMVSLPTFKPLVYNQTEHFEFPGAIVAKREIVEALAKIISSSHSS